MICLTNGCAGRHGEGGIECLTLGFVAPRNSSGDFPAADTPLGAPVPERTSAGSPIHVKNILYATDFSQASDRALPFALAVARAMGAKLYALHVISPPVGEFAAVDVPFPSLESEEETVQEEMVRLEAQLAGAPHEILIERSPSVWTAAAQAIGWYKIDLVVLGTHGRTGAEKLLLGSTAEAILRCCPVPVMTIGPGVRTGSHAAGHVHRLLLATDLSEDSERAARFAVALAEQNRAELKLIHVIEEYRQSRSRAVKRPPIAAADVWHELHELIPPNCELLCRPEIILEYGVPSGRILAAADAKGADLIVLGARQPRGSLLSATHLEGNTAHQILVNSRLPVITVLGSEGKGPQNPGSRSPERGDRGR